MGLQFFYHPDGVDASHAVLHPEESFHCVRVCRLKKGDRIGLTTGNGHTALGRIAEVQDERHVVVEILPGTEKFHPSPLQAVHLYVSILQDTSRMEWLTEKAAELGAISIQWLICRRTVKKHLRIDRLQRIALAALKQSGRPYRMHVAEPVPLAELARPNGLILWAHCEAGSFTMEKILRNHKKSQFRHLFIGPEGDFTPEETQSALDWGAHPLSLGPWRLRSETAALAAISLLAALDE
ncbi:MAG: 16S rRNA (uracil(1498)-N(3))-methyltransferase [Flavobacteriales bacterium]|nr:16S rRNA (uracil(1498)-N(3))-methyltransferase [Flavobacteriales bacterium]MDW8431318.1 RsmE family RNA methyltransferase [Flavobacteriales bacterium]